VAGVRGCQSWHRCFGHGVICRVRVLVDGCREGFGGHYLWDGSAAFDAGSHVADGGVWEVCPENAKVVGLAHQSDVRCGEAVFCHCLFPCRVLVRDADTGDIARYALATFPGVSQLDLVFELVSRLLSCSCVDLFHHLSEFSCKVVSC